MVSDSIKSIHHAIFKNQNYSEIQTGAHTIGLAQCATFSLRLCNFMDAHMAVDLRSFCPMKSDGNRATALDRNSTDVFDNHYFKNLINNKGLLASDQLLYTPEMRRLLPQPQHLLRPTP
ncbi:hypothetical protein ACLOJK_031047 [Asimina triloba]